MVGRPTDCLRVFYSSKYTAPLSAAHRFPMERYLETFKTLTTRIPKSQVQIMDPPEVSLDLLERYHDPIYVNKYLQGKLSEKEIRTLGFPWNEDFLMRTLLITGGTVEAMRMVVQEKNAFSKFTIICNLAGGFHHSFYDHGEGFCVFNDIVLSSMLAAEDYPDFRILVVDLDVHQGNGTAHMLRRLRNETGSKADAARRIYSLSVHGKNNYPFQKEQSDYDLELNDFMGDDEFMDTIEPVLENVFQLVHPDIVVYQSGVDGLDSDRWGRLSLSRNGLQMRNQKVFGLSRKYDASVVCTMGGGYSKPIHHSANAHVDVLQDAICCLQAADLSKCSKS